MKFEGYTDVKPHPDGVHTVLTKLTDFSSLHCDRPASDVRTRQPFRGRAIQMFIVTPREAAILHRED